MAENKRPYALDFDNYNNGLQENNDNWNYQNHKTPNQNENEGRNEGKRVDLASMSARKPTAKSKSGGKGKAKKSLLSSPMKPRNVLEDSLRFGEEENRDMSLVLEVDMQRMQLISPPPEETLSLRRHSSVRLSGQFTPSISGAETISYPNPPSPSRGSVSATTKRKRQQTARKTRTDTVADDNAMTGTDPIPQQQEQTPNPKPRKQVRHSRMASMDSPTRPSLSSSSYAQQENAPPTTPTRSTVNPRRVLFQSPHAKNPDADWIPPVPMLSLTSESTPATSIARRAVLGSRGSRRSMTPIPPYEPPTDVFTPPKEVYMSPPAAKISTRSTKKRSPMNANAAKKVKAKSQLRVAVKQEIPDDIDLTAPMPPPSPSDDPLLLSGPPEPVESSSPLRPRVERRLSFSFPTSSVSRREASVQAETDPAQGALERETLPPSSPEPPLESEDMNAVHAFDFGFAGNVSTDVDTEGDSVMRLDPRDADVEPVRLFDLDDFHSGSGAWSDSDDDDMQAPARPKENGEGQANPQELEEEGEGEYTGRWRMTKVRTKLDPPSSATRVRMEEWGRPISPFPKGTRLDLVGEEDERADDKVAEQEEDAKEEEEVRRMSVEPEDQVPVSSQEEEHDDQDEEEEREVREMSISFEDDDDDDDTSNGEINISDFTRPVIDEAPAREPSPTPTIKNAFDFSAIESPQAGPSNYSMVAVSPSVLQAALADDDTSMRDAFGENQGNEDDDDGESSADDEPGFVKITSADPRAAARAAAILKQHDYECYTKIAMKKQRRASHSAVSDLAKSARRRDILSAGISKSSTKNRRSMGVVGNQVFIPGTPVMTLPELLQEAEAEVGRELEVQKSPGLGSMSQVWSARAQAQLQDVQRDLFKTPVVNRRPKSLVLDIVDYESEYAWTKDDWKQLDACFTDQRLLVGATLEGAGEDTLAPVDMVAIDDVVDHFIEFVGGEEVVQSYGDAWSRDNLLERVRALQRKQRAGKVAPPTTPRSSSSFSLSLSPVAAPEPSPVALGGSRRVPSMEVPDFTPLGRRPGPPPRRSRAPVVLPAPVVHDAPFSNLGPDKEEQERPKKKIPATLLAPRYSHLLEEAVAINKEGEFKHPVQDTQDPEQEPMDSFFGSDSQSSFDQSQDDGDVDISQESIEDVPPKAPASRAHNPPNSTLTKRVTGFLFSYLPTLSSRPPSSLPPLRKPNALRQQGPALPLPPLEVLNKQRGPVTTPARQPLPKIRPPKELVHLHPAPPIQKSVLPRPVAKPKRLVELHHLSPPPEQPVAKTVVVPRPRRSSGSSVKDLVKGFEEIRKTEEKATVKRVKSIGEMRHKAAEGPVRPRWKL